MDFTYTKDELKIVKFMINHGYHIFDKGHMISKDGDIDHYILFTKTDDDFDMDNPCDMISVVGGVILNKKLAKLYKKEEK